MTKSGFSYEALDYTMEGHDNKIEALLDQTRDYAREYVNYMNMLIDRVHNPNLEGPIVCITTMETSE